MNRLDVLQVIVDKIQAETYLEIGVNRGQVISHLRCPRKIGVFEWLDRPRQLQAREGGMVAS